MGLDRDVLLINQMSEMKMKIEKKKQNYRDRNVRYIVHVQLSALDVDHWIERPKSIPTHEGLETFFIASCPSCYLSVSAAVVFTHVTSV